MQLHRNMDDTFGMLLCQNLSTERKMVAAITNGMSDSVNTLVESGGVSLMNAVLQQQSGRTALHIACQVGRHEYISLFAAAGADPGIVDFFGMTPLDLALRSGHEVCVREMLSLSRLTDPLVLWTAQTRAGNNAWRSFSTEVVCILIIATPNFGRCSEAVNAMQNDHFRQPEKYEHLIRTFLLTGNKLTAAQSAEVLGISVNIFQCSCLISIYICREIIFTIKLVSLNWYDIIIFLLVVICYCYCYCVQCPYLCKQVIYIFL